VESDPSNHILYSEALPNYLNLILYFNSPIVYKHQTICVQCKKDLKIEGTKDFKQLASIIMNLMTIIRRESSLQWNLKTSDLLS